MIPWLLAAAFPWALSTQPLIGVGGQLIPIPQAAAVSGPVNVVQGDCTIARTLTSYDYDLSIKVLPGYQLDPTVSLSGSGFTFAGNIGTSALPTSWAWAKTGPGGSVGEAGPPAGANPALEPWWYSTTSSVTAYGASGYSYANSATALVYKTDVFVSYASGTNNLRTATVTALSAKTASASAPFVSISGTTYTGSGYPFSTFDPGSGIATPNTACWLSGVDLTARSWWGESGDVTPKSLISPQHVVFCYHTAGLPAVGYIYDFWSGGSKYTGTVVRSARIVDPVNGQATDICVATFASAIPAAIKPFKLLPYGWAKTYAPGLIGHIPMIVLKNVNGPAISLGASTYWAYGIHSYGYSLPSYYTPSASAFYLATSTGDSGSPTLIYNPASNELGLAGVCYSSANASDVTDYIPQLNQYLWGDYTGGYTSTCYQIGSSTSPGSNPWSPGSSPPNLTYLPTTDLSSYPTY